MAVPKRIEIKGKDAEGGYKAKERNIKGVDESVIIRKFEDALLKYNTDEDDIIKALDDDPLRRKPDIYLAQKELNWEPKIMFKEGLAITREYFEKKLIFEKSK